MNVQNHSTVKCNGTHDNQDKIVNFVLSHMHKIESKGLFEISNLAVANLQKLFNTS